MSGTFLTTSSVFLTVFLTVMAADETCKYEFHVPTNGGCVVHTKEMELSYEQMKSDIASGHERTNAMAESFTKEIGVLHQKFEEQHERLGKLGKRVANLEDALRSLPQITQELAEVSKSLADTRRTSKTLRNEHDMFGNSLDQLKRDALGMARNISLLFTEVAEHRAALMTYGAALDKLKAAVDSVAGLQEEVRHLKDDLLSTRNVVADLNEKVFAMEESVKSTTAAMATLGRLPGLVKRLQEQVEHQTFNRRRRRSILDPGS